MIYPTYHNDDNVELIISGHDLLGNPMFEEQKLIYKIGQHVLCTIPQFDGYYIEQDKIDFYIEKDTKIKLIYRKYIYSHIDILDDEGYIVICDSLTNEYHLLEYDSRFGESLQYELPCVFEGDKYTYVLPYVKGYYRDVDTIEVIVEPHIVLKNIYHKIEDIIIDYVSERGITLDTQIIDPAEISDEQFENGIYSYAVDIPDSISDKYYYAPVDNIIEIPLKNKHNIIEIRLNHYRKICINTIKIDNDSDNPKTVTTVCLPDKYRIGDSYFVSPESIEGFYTEFKPLTFTIDEYYKYDKDTDEYIVNVDIEYYKLLTFNVWFIDDKGNQISSSGISNPEVISNLHHNTTYLYEAPEIPGYVTHTKYMYIRDIKNKTLHVEYHKI